jgi:hypothetical protein
VVTRDASDFFAAQWRIVDPFSGMVRRDFRTSGADDLVGSAKDFLGALFRYRVGVGTSSTAEPMLDIAASIIGSLKAQRFATKQRHGFGFDFAQTARRRLSIREVSLVAVKNGVPLCRIQHKDTYVDFAVM